MKLKSIQSTTVREPNDTYVDKKTVVYFDDQEIKEEHKDSTLFDVVIVPRYKGKQHVSNRDVTPFTIVNEKNKN